MTRAQPESTMTHRNREPFKTKFKSSSNASKTLRTGRHFVPKGSLRRRFILQLDRKKKDLAQAVEVTMAKPKRITC